MASRKPRLLNPDGTPRPKGKPRGVPGAPQLIPYRWKSGTAPNPKGRSRKARISEAVTQELSLKSGDGFTRAEVLASNLIDRAEIDSTELERVINITEPELLNKNSQLNGGFAAIKTKDTNIVVGKIFSTE